MLETLHPKWEIQYQLVVVNSLLPIDIVSTTYAHAGNTANCCSNSSLPTVFILFQPNSSCINTHNTLHLLDFWNFCCALEDFNLEWECQIELVYFRSCDPRVVTNYWFSSGDGFVSTSCCTVVVLSCQQNQIISGNLDCSDSYRSELLPILG